MHLWLKIQKINEKYKNKNHQDSPQRDSIYMYFLFFIPDLDGFKKNVNV